MQAENTVAHLMGTQTYDERLSIFQVSAALKKRWRRLVIGTLCGGAIAYGASYLIPPTFTAKTVILPPQQQPSIAASALASLGALSGLAGGSPGGVKTTADQYASLMQSANVQDRLIDRFNLKHEYELRYYDQARRELSQNTRIAIGKKDGLITVEVDASTPKLAAELANQHVTELRRLTDELALTEAKQRRVFFEGELKHTQELLTKAQRALQKGGFNADALRAEPKAAAESYGRLKAEVTSAEVRLQTQRQRFADNTPEVMQQSTLLSALQAQLRRLEDTERDAKGSTSGDDISYISRYRDYKYQESLYELFSRQFEAARLDESREGSIIQVIDFANEPEQRSRPKRSAMAAFAGVVVLLLMACWVMVAEFWQLGKSRA